MSEDNDDLNKNFSIDGETISLADLAGISLDSVTEKRGDSFPKGVFDWETDTETPPHLAVIGEGDKAKGAIVFKFKCLDVVTLSDPEFTGDPNSLIGKTHQETIFLSGKIEDALGYAKAFIKDIGGNVSGDLVSSLKACAGSRFRAPIGKRKNPNDTDVVYTNIVRGKIKPLASATTSDVAAQVAA